MRTLFILGFCGIIFLALWAENERLASEALDYQECGGRYCAELDQSARPAYKR